MTMSPKGGLFDALLDPIEGVETVLRELDNPAPSGAKEPRLLFVRYQEHKPLVDEFVELLSNQLVNYAIPLKKRKAANRSGAKSRTGGDTAMGQKLNREAINLLLKYNSAGTERYGELGELISYVVAVHFMGAPQVGSKMSLKTNTEMPVHGVDGIHARCNGDGSVTFFMLESKFAPSSTDATYAFCESIEKFYAGRGALLNELRLVTDLSNLDGLPEPHRTSAIEFFSPYSTSGASRKRRDRHVGSLLYNEAAYNDRLSVDDEDIEKHESHFAALLETRRSHMRTILTKQALARKMDLAICEVFLVAVPDTEELKKTFAELNGGHLR